MILISIDPGSNNIGYCILYFDKNNITYLTSNSIKVNDNIFIYKLKFIYFKIMDILKYFNPKQSAIEKIFVGKNINSSLKLCQARTVIMLALINFNIPIFEYNSKQIKKYSLNNIYSNKFYTRFFVKNIFNLYNVPSSDEADSISIGITHIKNFNFNK
ncbi:crossover junction endodeoxyribonuclease RuvC [endosymbiont of Euscepes postfasciatus]|uniref:crossover junction endodeoxyribonuclease RuvC n=1 Tax=endosymbiont of Euscepes postfasciatus TaxID=650377 RepID=UPI000DC713A6|nr:crossover junction endodeoxyribonuclease RuvC [endosymbiont of Euscepes postfasciatus]BBA84740.1 crossover junction endodeoxyribonuclease RuvC [endosymbiont of Euscepes postfasciatus]